MKKFIEYSLVFSVFTLLPWSSSFAAAAPPGSSDLIVVTASRIEEQADRTDGSVTVITREEIEARGYLTLEEVLRDVGGMYVYRQGTVGEITALRIRGSNRNETLLLLDGVKMNAPHNQTASFEDILVDNLERIEIVKGPRSALYGSEAMGGVINIITRKPEKNGVTVSGGMGNFGTHREQVSTTFLTGDIQGALSASFMETSGQYDHDAFREQGFSGRLGYALSDRLAVGVVSRFISSSKDIGLYDCCDSSAFSSGSFQMAWDQNATILRNTFVNTLTTDYYFSDTLDYTLRLTRSDFFEEEENPTDQTNAIVFRDKYTSYRNTVLLQQNLRLSNNTLIIGVEREEESVEILNMLAPNPPVLDDKRYGTSFYIQDGLTLPIAAHSLHFTLGTRVEDNREYGTEMVPRAALAFRASQGITVKSGYGKGIRAPSFAQLYGTTTGNKELKPEKVETVDVGIELLTFSKTLTLETTYFVSEYSNIITLDQALKLANINSAKIYGLESSLLWRPASPFRVSLNHTYLETRDNQTRTVLSFRPKHQFNLMGEYRRDQFTAALMMNSVSSSTILPPLSTLLDTKGEAFGDRNPSYTTLGLAGHYRFPVPGLRQKPLFELKINNLLDRDYEQVRGFPAQGINFLAEVSVPL